MESMKTGIIKFNIKDTKRKHSGKQRNFNVANIVKAINDPALQEQVKNGEITGFYSHLPRIKYGMSVKEAVFDGTKLIPLDPCFKTTYLKAYDDGTIEHEAEFINNEYGIKAFNLLKDKIGGFSSAISEKNNGEYIFHGFDYVKAPNFTENRPYSVHLDDTSEHFEPNQVIFLDNLTPEEINDEKILFLLDHIEFLESTNKDQGKQIELLSDTVESLSLQNQSLLDDIVSLELKISESMKKEKFSSENLEDLKKSAEKFDSADLVEENNQLSQEKKSDSRESAQIRNLLSRFF